MTLLTIAQELAKNVGLDVPTAVVSSPDRDWQEFLLIANQQGEELARRVDWGALTVLATLTGDGTFKTHSLPSGFKRVSPGITGPSNLRPLTRAEWASLTPSAGTPRYFLLEGSKITLWPYLATGATEKISYQSGDFTSSGQSAWTVDTETSLIDEDLFLKGVISRWRRQKGMDYADYEAEYEAALEEIAGFDDRGRI